MENIDLVGGQMAAGPEVYFPVIVRRSREEYLDLLYYCGEVWNQPKLNRNPWHIALSWAREEK